MEDQGKKPDSSSQSGSSQWFVPKFGDKNGPMQGPYSTDEIIKLVMDGKLKLESELFHVTERVWKVAADVFPQFKINNLDKKIHFQPPPKPVELKDVHVVDLNHERTAGIDYFALLKDKDAARKYQHRVDHSGQSTSSSTSRGSSSSSRNNTQPESNNVIKMTMEPESTDIADTIGDFLGKYQRPIGIAASLAFLAIGSYSVYEGLKDDSIRDIAQEKPEKEISQSSVVDERESSKSVSRSASGTESLSVSSSLGTGKHKVHKFRGNVSTRKEVPHPVVSAAPPPPPPPTRPADRNDNQNQYQQDNYSNGAVTPPNYQPSGGAVTSSGGSFASSPNIIRNQPVPAPQPNQGYPEQTYPSDAANYQAVPSENNEYQNPNDYQNDQYNNYNNGNNVDPQTGYPQNPYYTDGPPPNQDPNAGQVDGSQF
ncbi:MAG: hypothetical protein AB7F43_13230 [Bacteriovoracia bacterium]